MSDQIQKTDPLEGLTTKERGAYRLSVERKEPFLSPGLQDQLYSLYQMGKTCDEIQALNPKLSLGIIVRARVDYGWDQRRAEYLQSMVDKARQQATQLSHESLGFIGTLLTAFHKHDQERLLRFIQTGDMEELKGALMVSNSNLKVYKETLELLLKLTGQDTTKKVSGSVTHHHVVKTDTVDAEDAEIVEIPALPASRPVPPKSAAEALAAIHKNRQKS